MTKPAIAFDTLAYAKKLKAVGFTEDQAEVQAEVLAEMLTDNLATKLDLKKVESTLKLDIETLRRDMKELEINFKHDLKELEINLKHDLKELENRLVIRLTGIIVITVGLFSTLLGIFLKLIH